MSKTAINWGKFVFLCLVFSAAIFAFPKSIFATQYQQCTTNGTCTVGEFLYDDDYQPISVGSTCTLTSRYPNGNILLNAETLIGTSDGWYSYSVGTSGLSSGVYRGQMCCVTNGENICLDKTFEISSTFSTLASDIWASPNRSLTSFGDLVSNIWNHSSRQLTSSNLGDGTSLATTESMSNIGASLTTLSAQVSNVQTNIVTIDTKITSLQTQVGTIATDTSNLLSKWGSYSQADVINYIDTLETQLGNNTQTCSDDSVFGQIECVKDKWGSQSAATIYAAANNAYTTASNLRSEIGFNGKSTTAYDEAMAIKAYVDTIEGSIGSTSDTSSASSLFGRIKQVKEAVDAIDSSTLDLNDLLAKWDDLSASDIYDKVTALSTQVSSINTISNVDNITNNNITQTTDLGDIKNQILAMRALLDANRIQLEKLDNKPIVKSWLENGSIIFKSLITNPSSAVKQDVAFVYYLPPEVKEADIIKKSDNITIKYDTSQGVFYATGDFKLKPKETLIVEVEVKDIWSVPQEKIDSLRRQATELFTPLKKTSYFAQGSTLHSDIQASLDRIVEIQKPSKLPEEKIKDYREAQIELESVNKKMDSLKEIVASAGSIGTLSGFIGGVQTLGVWGIIVVLVAGFVFLAIYIKSLSSKGKNKTKVSVTPEPTNYNSGPTYNNFQKKSPTTSKKINQDLFLNENNLEKEPDPIFKKPIKELNGILNIRFFLLMLTFGFSSVLTGTSVGLFLINKSKKENVSKPAVLSAQTSASPTPVVEAAESVPEPTITETPIIENSEPASPEPVEAAESATEPTPTPVASSTPKISNQIKAIVVPSINSFVNVRAEADRNSAFVSKIPSGSELVVIAEKYNELGEKWLKISTGETQGWVLGQLIQYVQGSTLAATSTIAAPSAKIKINVPPHDIVFIYSKPSYNASITYKISESQNADILLETKMWAKVILSRINIEGWVSQDFIQRNIP